MNRSDRAEELFRMGYNCCQSTFGAFCDVTGLTLDEAMKIASPFGAGFGKLREVCGAVTGALMVLGMLYGQYDMNDMESRMKANKVNDEMMKRFKEKNETYICNNLLGCDISSPQGVQYALDNKLFIDFCPKMVESAVEILEEIIDENPY